MSTKSTKSLLGQEEKRQEVQYGLMVKASFDMAVGLHYGPIFVIVVAKSHIQDLILILFL